MRTDATSLLAASGAACRLQLDSNSSNDAAGTRLRRKLSKIFQRLISVSGFGVRVRRSCGRDSREDPRCNLPVSANPSMLPFAVARVVVRELLEEFHVRGQGDANVCSFDEIVAEQPLLRESGR